MYLFTSIKHQLSGQEIEYVLHPGQATTTLGLLKYPGDFSKSQGLHQLWYKDTTHNAENNSWNMRKQRVMNNPD